MSDNEGTNQTQHKPTKEDIEKLNALIGDIKNAMLTTKDQESEQIRSRPMWTVKEDVAGAGSGHLWFFTGKSSVKVDELEKDRRVNVSYSKQENNTWVSIVGKAYHVEDKNKIKELWDDNLKAWFPKGLDDPEISLIRVDIEGAEVWDSHSGVFVRLFGFLKAAITGEVYQPSEEENKKIDLSK
ncbi:hypothetical protein AKO1_012212 [Acrasis kona]|uniref:General stress protein FMN-binding split barrel domain-containing protein n=1 Tax=Acrasis kona TaxID=1008807 RepID=A0AAW2ZF74_9EUKA